MNLSSFFNFSGISINWLFIFSYLAAYLIASYILRALLIKLVALIFKPKWQAFLKSFSFPAVFILLLPFLWASYRNLQLTGAIADIAQSIVQALTCVSILWIINSTISNFLDGILEYSKLNNSPLQIEFIPVAKKTVRYLIYFSGILLVLKIFGVDVFSIVTGLGLGGIILALAAKDAAANLFASVMIHLDQAFKVGDFIKVDSTEGTIEAVNLRTTRLRTTYDSVITLPNSTFVASKVDNLGKRNLRRFKQIIHLEIATPASNIKSYIAAIEQCTQKNTTIAHERTEVKLTQLNDSSLGVLVYVFFKVNSWSEELKLRESLIFDILRLAKECHTPLAFPTQTLLFKADATAELNEQVT